MKLSVMAALLAVALLTVATSAEARNYRHHQHHAAHIQATDANGNRASGLVTIDVAGGHRITVSHVFAAPISALIADLHAHGYRFTRIKCFANRGEGHHKSRSNHWGGNACDFFGRHPPASITRAHDLRSGCDFGDCMHVDNAQNVGGVAFWNSVKHQHYATAGRSTRSYAARRHHHRRYASR